MTCHPFCFTIRKFLFSLLFIVCIRGWGQDPSILFLTWNGDPATTMTVIWHTTTGNGNPTTVYYKKRDKIKWKQMDGKARRLNRSSIKIHQVELKGLKEDTEYFFHLPDGEIHKFRTLPDGLKRPLKIVIGGDAYLEKDLFETMNREVVSKDPDFVILAGDIAYTEGLRNALRPNYWKIERWEEFFRIWSRDMIASDGRLIPIMPVLGNHDVKEGFDHPRKGQVFFYEYFALPEDAKSYRLMKIGNDLCFYLLDSGHLYPIAGAQAEWLDKQLRETEGALYQIPVYHIAAYPSEVSYTHRGSQDIRKFWVPLFEKYQLQVSMEHDNHTFKRTFPIKNGVVDSTGVIYLGDGSWGVPPRKPKRHWYLAKTLKTNCYWLLKISQEKGQFEAFNQVGDLLDTHEINSKRN